MGWGLAGTGNSSAAAAAVAAAVVAPGRGGGSKWKSQDRVGFLGNRVKIVGKIVQIGENSENRNLRWGIPDSADRSVLKS